MVQRLALVRPPVDVLHKFSKPVECLATAYVAAAARQAGHEAVMVDGMLHDWTVDETTRRILDAEPTVVGFTVVLNHFPPQVTDIASRLRDGGFGGPIIAGGHAVSFFPERVLEHPTGMDAVVCGEGEVPTAAILGALDGGGRWQDAPGVASRDGQGVRRNPVRRLTDVSLLGHPARDVTADVIDLDGLVAVSTSRGCYARCNFCSIPRFYGLERGGKGLPSGDWLGREPADVVAEVVDLHERFGMVELLVVDDEFFGGKRLGFDRALEFGTLMRQAAVPVGYAMSCRAENVDEAVLERLAAGGLRHVFIGLESGVEANLKLYGKGHSREQNRQAVETVKRLGLSFQPGFMLFNFKSTLAQVREDLAFLREIGECKPVTINSSVEPHFGAPFTRLMASGGALVDEGLHLQGRFLDPGVELVKRVAEMAAKAFEPYMNTIAGLQSAVTYEWRRDVPGRRPQERRLIAAFESRANRALADVVVQAVDELLAGRHAGVTGGVTGAKAFLAEFGQRIASVCEDLDIARSLLLLHVEQVEGQVRYWRQRDVVDAASTA